MVLERRPPRWRRGAAFGLAAVALASAHGGCAASPRAWPSSVELVDLSGSSHDARRLVAEAPLTVFVFASRDCDCFTAHEDRIRALARANEACGVRFFVIDSERDAPSRAASAAAASLDPPLLFDPDARLARALGAEFAATAVVVDARGTVRYRGGIDSDRAHLHDDATPYLRSAIEDLLAGRDPHAGGSATLGCPLRRW